MQPRLGGLSACCCCCCRLFSSSSFIDATNLAVRRLPSSSRYTLIAAGPPAIARSTSSKLFISSRVGLRPSSRIHFMPFGTQLRRFSSAFLSRSSRHALDSSRLSFFCAFHVSVLSRSSTSAAESLVLDLSCCLATLAFPAAAQAARFASRAAACSWVQVPPHLLEPYHGSLVLETEEEEREEEECKPAPEPEVPLAVLVVGFEAGFLTGAFLGVAFFFGAALPFFAAAAAVVFFFFAAASAVAFLVTPAAFVRGPGAVVAGGGAGAALSWSYGGRETLGTVELGLDETAGVSVSTRCATLRKTRLFFFLIERRIEEDRIRKEGKGMVGKGR